MSSASNFLSRNNLLQNERTVKSVIDLLVHENEPMPLKDICQRLYRNLAGKQQLYELLCRYPSNFQMDDDYRKCVRLVTKLRICEMHCIQGKGCSKTFCNKLHICKFYILSDTCSFKSRCTFGHDLETEHNNSVLKECLLDDLNAEDIEFLLRKAENRNGVTVPKICKFYNMKAGCKFSVERKDCHNLHICKNYVLDKCTFGKMCSRSHNILSQDIKEILKRYGIDVNRIPKEILIDLRQATYNAEDDESGSTTSDCSNNQYDLEDDMAGIQVNNARPRSALNTRVSAQNPPLRPSNRCCSMEVVSTLSKPIAFRTPLGRNQHRSGSRDRNPSHNPPSDYQGNRPRSGSIGANVGRSAQDRGAAQGELSMDQTTTDMVCLYYLQGKCWFGQNCRNFHCSMPYQWRYKTAQAKSWEIVDHSENEDIELSYSDPKCQEYVMPLGDRFLKINFKTMTGVDVDEQMHNIQRLSTLSSFVSDKPLATKWLWYWKTVETGDWKEYGDINGGYKATLTSSDIEEAYLSRPEGQMAFATQGHEYVLDFTKMCQRNLKYTTEREVCRRPIFVMAKEVAIKKKQHSSNKDQRYGAVGNALGNPSIIQAPSYWTNEPDTDLMDHYSLVKLAEKHPVLGKEYMEIKQIFMESLPKAQISSIERIENGDLWISYVSKKTCMSKKNNNTPVDERRLFHGTEPQHVTPICKQGFDFRLSGRTCGMAQYGKGSYFATRSEYSHLYTGNSNRIMFVVKVLVGDYTLGKSEYIRPPSKNTDNPCSDLYDSCVDDIINPKIFAIFDNGQVYPEYCITYN